MREYFYRIDASGRLSHEGSELSDPAFLDFFFSRLVPNKPGPTAILMYHPAAMK